MNRIDRNERFTECAEVAILTEALKTSYAEAANVLPSRQKISKTTVLNKVHSIASEPSARIVSIISLNCSKVKATVVL